MRRKAMMNRLVWDEPKPATKTAGIRQWLVIFANVFGA
jgi:hypothetical protein